MTALVRIALVEAVARYEKKYNAGMAFPPPARLRRGRAPKHAELRRTAAGARRGTRRLGA